MGPCTGNVSPTHSRLLPSSGSTASNSSSTPPHTPSPPSRTSPSSSTPPRVVQLPLSNRSPNNPCNTLNFASFIRNGLSDNSLCNIARPVTNVNNILPSNLPKTLPVPSLSNNNVNRSNSNPLQMSAFSIPKQSPRSVDSSRALQLAAVDSTNSNSPRVSSRSPDSSVESPTHNSLDYNSSNSSCTNREIDVNNSYNIARNHVKEEKLRPIKASSSRPASCKESKVWRPY